jgi:hypothetical protein
VETTDQNSDEQQALQPVDTDNQSPIETEPEHTTQRNWPMLLALFVAALAFAVLVVFTGRWVYHSVHNKSTVKPAPANSKSLTKSPTGESGASNSGSVAKPNTSTSGSAGNSGSSTSTNSTNSNQISNTGPGDIVAIFAISSFAAASLHYIISLRKQSQG